MAQKILRAAIFMSQVGEFFRYLYTEMLSVTDSSSEALLALRTANSF